MDRESCCALCAATPWCAAAALSGEADEPPSACWLKRKAGPLQYKRGVTVCIPSKEARARRRRRRRHQPIPA